MANNICLQYARWDDLPPEIQNQFTGFMGGEKEHGKSFYQLYFYWYNIPHEIGHVLRDAYHTHSGRVWTEENSVNQLAVAYWRAKGQTRLLMELEKEVRRALLNIPDPVPANEDRETYLNNHSQELGNNPTAYGHYQFSMVRSALERPLDLSQALKTLVSPDANDGSTIPLSPDYPLDDQLPCRTVEDMRRTLAAYGLSVPEVQVVCAYAPALQFIYWS